MLDQNRLYRSRNIFIRHTHFKSHFKKRISTLLFLKHSFKTFLAKRIFSSSQNFLHEEAIKYDCNDVKMKNY